MPFIERYFVLCHLFRMSRNKLCTTFNTFLSLATSDSCIQSDSSASVAALGSVLGVVIVTAIVVQAMVIVFFIRKLQRAKGNMTMDHHQKQSTLFSFYAASTNTGVEMPTFSGKKYL